MACSAGDAGSGSANGSNWAATAAPHCANIGRSPAGTPRKRPSASTAKRKRELGDQIDLGAVGERGLQGADVLVDQSGQYRLEPPQRGRTHHRRHRRAQPTVVRLVRVQHGGRQTCAALPRALTAGGREHRVPQHPEHISVPRDEPEVWPVPHGQALYRIILTQGSVERIGVEAGLVRTRVEQRNHRNRAQCMVRPPSTVRTCPVTNAASVEQRKSIGPTRSAALLRPFQRLIADDLVDRLLTDPGQLRIGDDRTWRQCVDGDAVVAELPGQRLGEAEHAGFRGDVVRHVRQPGEDEIGDDIDDGTTALRSHHGQDGPGAEEHALQIQRHHAAPRVEIDVVERHMRIAARVVDEHVDPLEFGDGLRYQGSRRFFGRDVGADAECPCAAELLVERAGQRLGPDFVQIGDDDLRTGRDEVHAVRPADSVGPSGHHHNPAAQPIHSIAGTVVRGHQFCSPARSLSVEKNISRFPSRS